MMWCIYLTIVLIVGALIYNEEPDGTVDIGDLLAILFTSILFPLGIYYLIKEKEILSKTLWTKKDED